jgi:DNA invertase Pin-like site-specific DNA recombinase
VAASAVIYCRISQARDGTEAGVERQEADCRALAAERGWDVAEVFIDNDVSAFSGKRRPAFEAMLTAIKAGAASVIVTYAADRLYRRNADLERLVTQLTGVDVVTVRSGDIDLSTADGRATARILGTMAARESEKTAERVRRAKAAKAAAGAPAGHQRAYGFEPDGVTIREAEAAHLRAAFAAVAEGQSLRSVARAMNAAGSRRPRGAEWNGSAVRQTLLKPRYAGLRQHGEDATGRPVIAGKAAWPAIVDEDTFHLVGAILTNPGRRTTVGRPPTSLLAGTLKCTRCGVGLNAARVKTKTGDKRAVYACRRCGRLRGRDDLDAVVSGVVLARLEAGGVVPATPPEAASAAQIEAHALRAQLDAYAEAAATMPPAAYAAATSKIAARLAEAEAMIAATAQHRTVATIGADVGAGWEAADVDTRRAIVQELLERIDVEAGARGLYGLDAAAHGLTYVWRTA